MQDYAGLRTILLWIYGGVCGIVKLSEKQRRIRMDSQEVVCYCAGVTKSQILEALDNGARNLDDIKQMTGACTIGRCKELSPTGK